MTSPLFSNITLIGLGQIGGSLALALKEYGAAEHITGYDLDPQYAQLILEHNGIDSIATNIGDAVAGADVTILCTPVSTYGTLMQQIAEHLKPGSILTDVGSIKLHAIQDLVPLMPGNVFLVPSHPIAGTERSGAEVARASLFANRPFIVTPLEGMSTEPIDAIKALWERIDAHIILLPPDIHDQIYCYTSHLPHLLSFTAGHVLHTHHITASPDPLFQGFIRIGRSEPQMWRDVFTHNQNNMITGLDQILYLLNHMRGELLSGKETAQASLDDNTIATMLFPRVAASVMVSALSMCEQQVGQSLVRYTGAGFSDFVAPVTQAPDNDIELISNHAPQVAMWMEHYITELKALRTTIANNDEQALLTLLQNMRRSGLALVE